MWLRAIDTSIKCSSELKLKKFFQNLQRVSRTSCWKLPLYIAAVSCSSTGPRLGGIDRYIFVTGKPRLALVGAWVHGMVGLHWGVCCFVLSVPVLGYLSLWRHLWLSATCTHAPTHARRGLPVTKMHRSIPPNLGPVELHDTAAIC